MINIEICSVQGSKARGSVDDVNREEVEEKDCDVDELAEVCIFVYVTLYIMSVCTGVCVYYNVYNYGCRTWGVILRLSVVREVLRKELQ